MSDNSPVCLMAPYNGDSKVVSAVKVIINLQQAIRHSTHQAQELLSIHTVASWRSDFTLSAAEEWLPGGLGSTWGIVVGSLKYFDPLFSCASVSWPNITLAHWVCTTALPRASFPAPPVLGTYSSWVSKAEKWVAVSWEPEAGS